MLYRMTYPTVAQTDFPISDLLARIRELETELAAERAARVAPPVAKPAKPKLNPKRATDDYRTAAELWLAGEAVETLPPKAYKAGAARTVLVTFADGQALRLSTYLPGAHGIAAAVRSARAVRQAKPDDAKPDYSELVAHYEARNPPPADDIADPEAYGVWFREKIRALQATIDAMRPAGGTWCRDARGAHRLVDVHPCPEVVSADFVDPSDEDGAS